MTEPDWLTWARELQAIAQTGLAFTRDPYDRERYETLRLLAARAMAAHTDGNVQRIVDLFAGEQGYATPKVDVRAAAFRDGRILLVRELVDAGRWTLPGGWADVNLTGAENVAKEVMEEAGYTTRAVKLAAAWDRTRQGHPPSPFSCLKLFYLCEITGGTASDSLETQGAAFFGPDEIPDDLSLGRVLPGQIQRMFEHFRHPELPTDFD
ncbi:putative ADP-ribose pyrophosphatase YjhB [Rhodovastum atsumiense]|uniref:NUDIX hydrolase n=1 Tax=Rhodovastum atsumiense TaxID=504468 RepID=A0A5M6IN86_9PROT|nr:NUDIX hydrolase [Rhodovastum atsumiense]KAA5609723.1 NUDIX hydrolase [Rhodovastum atsumiense]CAH2604492.1 putative ADP-ribose pyrophosphatase YjhB [Rhodovastum atsumiense]